ncbi:hypothetical protein BGW42_003819 [Actinomortierella wolfii]|nr:hypothetical protein BGW42_003819 [Actinomortierella wolfii]
MQNDKASVRAIRTSLFARRTGFTTAARSGITETSESSATSGGEAFASKPVGASTATTSSGIMEKSSLSALSTLSGIAVTRSSTAGVAQEPSVRLPVMSKADDKNNPFLQRPARKLFKPDSQNNGADSTTTKASTNSTAAQSSVLSALSGRKPSTAAATLRPNTERLTLTRVMPLNSPTKPGAKSTVAVTSTHEQDTPRSTSFSLFGQKHTPAHPTASTTPSRNNIAPGVNGSTTPKMTPNPKYFEALNLSQTGPAPKLDLVGLASNKDSSAQNTSEQESLNKEQEEEEDPASTAAATFSSTAFAFARKSIMKHAGTKPQTILQSVARVAEEQHGAPSYTSLLSASTFAPRLEANSTKISNSHISTTSALDVNNPNISTTKASATLGSNSAATSREQVSASVQRNPDNHPRPQLSSPPPTSETRGVLDLSDRSDPKKASTLATWASSTTTRPTPLDSQGQHKETSDSTRESLVTEEAGRSQRRFDLRAALLSESSRSKYELPALTASQAPHSPRGASKSAPYQVPSTTERQAMRINRRPGYKALPLNPKIFTSAGDLGVPRIPKAPLTIPRSPKFSKIRSRHTAASQETTTGVTSGPIRTTTASRVANLIRQGKVNEPRPTPTRVAGNTPATTQAGTSTTAGSVSLSSLLRLGAGHKVSGNIEKLSTSHAHQPTTSETTDNQSRSTLLTVPQGGTTSAAAPRSAVTGATTQRPFTKRPLTQPIPFKFATDSLLRKRTAYEPTSVKSFRLEHVQPSASRPPKPPPTQYQRPLKRLTVPKPFTFLTDIRAEMHHSNFRRANMEHRQQQNPNHGVISREMLSSRPSRLANLVPISRPNAAAPTSRPPEATASTRSQPALRPPRITVPISPKLGRDPQVRVVRPVIPFIPKKSTKELTQPIGFRFNTDERLEARRAHVHSEVRDQEHDEIEARWMRQHTLEQKMATRQRLESTFKARPIAHYPPIHIRPAKKALTVPVSPLIGEKRKRYEAALRATTHEAEEDEVGAVNDLESHHQDEEVEIENTEIYRQFEEGRLMQEQQERLKQQLKDQEHRQLELANSSHANVQQPPLRISFPYDPKTQALQQDDNIAVETSDFRARDEVDQHDSEHPHEEQKIKSGKLSLAAVQSERRISGGVSNRRISLETSKAIEKGASRRISGRARRTSRESSPEHAGGSGAAKPLEYEPYYAFSRSMERTVASGTATTEAPITSVKPADNDPSSDNEPKGGNGSSSRPWEAGRGSSGQKEQSPAFISESTSEVGALPTASTHPKQHTDQEDPDRRRSGSFFLLDRDVPSSSDTRAVSRRISAEASNHPDRRRSGSFIPLDVAVTKNNQGSKDKEKNKRATLAAAGSAAGSANTVKTRQSVSLLITGAAQKHRLPIPSNSTRGRIFPSTLGIRPSTNTNIMPASAEVASTKDTLQPSSNSNAVGRSLSLSDLL